LQFAAANNVIPLTPHSVTVSADIYADLRERGEPIDDIDLLIAGTALAHNLILITHNRKHFERIADLQIEDWSET
jgi:tRNA(fMet)-specific endonuclease VapC